MSRQPLYAPLAPAIADPKRARRLEHLTCAAYLALAEGRQANYELWLGVRAEIAALRGHYEQAGFEAPPFAWDAFWARLDLPLPSQDRLGHVELLTALMADYGGRVEAHILYRLAHEGNFHFDFQGGTGMAKSSCAIHVLDWTKPTPPAKLADHLNFDVGQLPAKLRGKKAGDTVVQDEYVASAGQGARTQQMVFENLEDTIRASQINLIRCSPRQHNIGTMQAVFEVILWNPKKKQSLFLVWLEGRPRGVIVLPWCSSAHYAAYRPWKAENLERSVGGAFRDNSFLVRTTLEIMADPRFVAFLCDGANKPTKRDFELALDLFYPQMMTLAQTEALSKFMHNICYAYDRIGPKFKEYFGLEPSHGLQKVAAKCYKE